MFKRLCLDKQWILKLAMVVAVLTVMVVLPPTEVQAAEVTGSGTCGDNLTWELDSEGTLTVSGTGAMKNYTSSSSAPWYGNRNSVSTVVIEDGVTSIGSYAFYYCTGLTSITIPDSVTSIGSYAFYYCAGLTSITIPASVTSIGSYAFYSMYRYTGLTGVYITDIAAWCNISFGNYSANPLHYAEKLYLKDSLVTNLVIPDGITSVGRYAFYNCKSLTEITIPNSVTSIGASAFSGCSGLESITLPFVGSSATATTASVSTLFGYIFGNSSYTGGTETYQAYGSGSETYYIPSSLKNVTITGGNILYGAFYNCTGLTEITLPNGTTSIGNYAFYNCKSLTEITIPNSFTSIGNSAFSDCTGLTSMIIGNGVTSIGNYAFNDCTGLTSVTLGDSVTSIGSDAFIYCKGLTGVYITDIAVWCNIDFGNRTSNPLYNAENLYLDGELVTELVIPDGVTSIGSWAFSGCTSLTSIDIPNSVTSIGGSAFSGCSSLESITLPFVGSNATATTASSSTLFGYIFGTNHYSGGIEAIQICPSQNGLSPTATITYYIPSSLKAVTITGGNILYGAFSRCSGLTSIDIPNSVTSIGDKAFYDCTGLTSIDIPNSVTSIGDCAFEGCTGLTSVTIPDSVTSIGYRAFYNCEMTSVNIGSGVISIGDYAFNYDSVYSRLSAIYFKGNAPAIGTNSFPSTTAGKFVIYYDSSTSGWTTPQWNGYYCYPIEEVLDYSTLDANNTNRQGIQFTLDDDAKEATVIGGYFGAGGRNVRIPEIVVKNGETYLVTAIEKKAFYANQVILSVSIPSSVLSIGDNAFGKCVNLKKITVDSENSRYMSDEYGVLYNGSKTQLICYPAGSDITEYTVPATVTSIKAGAFGGVQHLESLTLPFVGSSATATTASTSTLFGYIFGDSSDTGKVGIEQYYGSSLRTYYYIPSSLKEVTITGGNILYGAFYNCKGLTKITIGNGVASIGENVFYNCAGLTSVTIGNSVTSIGNSAFYGCTGLKNITVGNSVTSIGEYAFNGCTSLTEITIPNSVTSIGEYAFYRCSSLESITIPFVGGSKKTATDTYQYPFGYIFGTSSYTGGTKTTQYYYGSSTTSTTYSTYYIPTSLKSVTVTGGEILYGAFYNCNGLTNITIGNNVTSIGDKAFYNCTGLKSVTIDNGVTSIGNSAFSGCTSLTRIDIPNNVTSIGNSAFSGCTSLTRIDIPNSVTSIGNSAFSGCTSLTSINIPNSVTSIGNSAFSGCTSLTSIDIPNNVTTIGASAFRGCNSLESITLPFVGSNATETTASPSTLFGYIFGTEGYTGATETTQYYGSSSSTYYYIPSSLKHVTITGGNILYGAFYNCTGLKSVTIGNSVTSIGNKAFYNCTGLKSVTVGDSVTRIGEYAFRNCTGLTSVHITDLAAWCKIDFYYINVQNYHVSSNPLLYARNLYLDGELVTEPVTSPGITKIKPYAFYNCTSLTSITIPDSVTSVGSQAFYNCSGVETVYLNKHITNLSAFNFSQYTSLKKIIVSPENTTYSSDSYGVLFNKDKTTLICYPQARTVKYYNIPTTVTNIGSDAFINNSYLTNIVVPEEVKTIVSGNFLNCPKVYLLVYLDSAAYNYAVSNNLSFDIINSELVYTGISVAVLPDITKYVEGTEIRFDGLVIVGMSDYGYVQIDGYELSYQADTVGKHTVTVNYKGFTTSFEIEIVEKTLVGIEITTLPTKTEYVEGLPLDFAGMIVTGYYDNGTSEVIGNYSYSGYNKDFVGKQVVSVNYGEFTDTFEVTVVAKQLVGIEIVTEPSKKIYKLGEELQLAGLVVKLYYDNGTYEDAEIQYAVSGYNKNVLGEQTITVTYGDYTDTFKVTLIKHTAAVAGAPTLQSKTDTSVTLNVQEGCEYSKDGIHWQTSAHFNNLDPHTAYTFYARYAETADTYAGASSAALRVTTCYTLTGYAKVNGVLAEGNTLTANIDNITPLGKTVTYQWYRDGVIIDGEISATYVVKATDANSYITVSVIGTGEYYGELSGYAQAPLAKPVSSSCSSIAVEKIPGNEYSIDGETWQSEAVFKNLRVNTQYTVYQRVAATATTVASDASVCLINTADHAPGTSATCTEPQKCTVCGDEINPALGHDFSVDKHDADYHWQKCSRCDEIDGKEKHTGGAATCTTQKVCTDCGTAYGNPLGHDFSVDKHDADYHWQKCSRCDEIDGKEKHVGGTATCTTQKVCTDCGTAYGNPLGHDFNVDKHDADYHWQKCSRCDEIDGKEKHVGGTATCTTQKVCTDCGTAYGNPLGHDFSVDKHDADYHWQKCSRCDEIDGKEKHTGGTATCTTQKVCTDCGTAYGNPLGHDFSVDKHDADYHWQKCSRCDEIDGKEKHIGGAATCTTQKVCTDCGTAYGNPLGHNFSVDKHDADYHWQKCSRCDEIDGKEKHTGGTATCTTQKVCTDCGTAYGNTLEHNFSVDKHDADYHWQKCSRCDEIDGKEKHIGGTATCTTQKVCTDCGTAYGNPLGHDFSVDKHDANYHWHECSVCGDKKDVGAHVYDDESDLICNVCNELKYTIGDIDGNEDINKDDAIYILMSTFFPEDYPLNQDCDFDGNGTVNKDDAIYLLMYTFFPEDYPITAVQNTTYALVPNRKRDEE